MEQTPRVLEIPEATKNGDVVKFTLTVNGKDSIYRTYEDFSWMVHCLKHSTRTQGIIYPPMPKAPIVDAKQAEKRAREQYGSSSAVLPSDTLTSECRQMERFMKMLIAHPVLSESQVLIDFLNNQEAPPAVNLKQSRVLKWSASVTEKMKSNHKDIHPFFEDERNKTNSAINLFTRCIDTFSRMVTANNRLSIAYSDLSIEGLPSNSVDSSDSTPLKRFGAIFSRIYTDLQHCDQTLSEDSERTLGRFFSFYGGYHDALKEALYKRTCLLIAFQEAAKASDKAKPDKKATAEEQKTVKWKEFEDFTHELKEEIVRFHRERLEATHRAIVHFSRAQTKAAVDRHALVTQELNVLKNIPIDD